MAKHKREVCGETQRQCGLERPGHQQFCWNVETPWEAADYNIANMPTELFSRKLISNIWHRSIKGYRLQYYRLQYSQYANRVLFRKLISHRCWADNLASQCKRCKIVPFHCGAKLSSFYIVVPNCSGAKLSHDL